MLYLFSNMVETFFGTCIFINALLFLPQAIKLYKAKNAKNFSLTSFLGFNIIQISIILHGYINQDIILTLGTLLSLLTCGSITIMIIIFNVKNKTEKIL